MVFPIVIVCILAVMLILVAAFKPRDGKLPPPNSPDWNVVHNIEWVIFWYLILTVVLFLVWWWIDEASNKADNVWGFQEFKDHLRIIWIWPLVIICLPGVGIYLLVKKFGEYLDDRAKFKRHMIKNPQAQPKEQEPEDVLMEHLS